ncbi:DUF3394 domain-containing protein, partial [Cribrihabitans sp. XS_ASV171]
VVTAGPEETGEARADAIGFMILEEDGLVKLDEPMFGTPLQSDLDGFDFYADEPVRITLVRADAPQPPKELVFIPALVLLALIALLQRARMGRPSRQGETA